jgi:uncharacterized protein YdaU (DUF1376 family)
VEKSKYKTNIFFEKIRQNEWEIKKLSEEIKKYTKKDCRFEGERKKIS